jgi:hypothetical protein
MPVGKTGSIREIADKGDMLVTADGRTARIVESHGVVQSTCCAEISLESTAHFQRTQLSISKIHATCVENFRVMFSMVYKSIVRHATLRGWPIFEHLSSFECFLRTASDKVDLRPDARDRTDRTDA